MLYRYQGVTLGEQLQFSEAGLLDIQNTNILVRNSRVHSVLVHVLSKLSTVFNKQYLVAQIALHCDGCVCVRLVLRSSGAENSIPR